MNIYLCIFFLVILTEILVLLLRFFQIEKKSPLRTEALCYSSFSVRHSGRKETFLTVLHWKVKSGRAGNLILMLQSLTSHFDEFTSQLRAQESTSSYWLVTFQNGSGGGQIKKPRWGFPSWWLKFFPFPSLNTGPAGGRVESGSVRLSTPQRTEEKMTMWKVSQPAAAESQYPASRLGAFSFLTLLHWLGVRSH